MPPPWRRQTSAPPPAPSVCDPAADSRREYGSAEVLVEEGENLPPPFVARLGIIAELHQRHHRLPPAVLAVGEKAVAGVEDVDLRGIVTDGGQPARELLRRLAHAAV